MKPLPTSPPIASPHGSGAPVVPPPLDTEVAYLVVSFPFRAAFRYAFFEGFTPGMAFTVFGLPLIIALLLSPFTVTRYGLWAFAAIFFGFVALAVALAVAVGVPSVLLIRLFSSRHFLVRLSSEGLSKFYPQRDVHYSWRSLTWILERGGDLWISTFVDGCFIPRDCFASPEDAREFAALIRELKTSKGAAWRPEWNGRVFGVHPYQPIVESPDS